MRLGDGGGGDMGESPGLQIRCFEAPMGNGTTAGTALSAGRGKSFPSRIFPFCVAYPQQRLFLQTLRTGIQGLGHR